MRLGRRRPVGEVGQVGAVRVDGVDVVVAIPGTVESDLRAVGRLVEVVG
jgi:hypothetical protein